MDFGKRVAGSGEKRIFIAFGIERSKPTADVVVS